VLFVSSPDHNQIKMKMNKFLILLFFTISAAFSAGAQQLKVEPSFWWSGMAETELQLMVSGNQVLTLFSPSHLKHHESKRW